MGAKRRTEAKWPAEVVWLEMTLGFDILLHFVPQLLERRLVVVTTPASRCLLLVPRNWSPDAYGWFGKAPQPGLTRGPAAAVCHGGLGSVARL